MINKTRLLGTVNNTVSTEFERAKKQKGEGETFWQGVAGGAVDVLIVAHREKVAAALRRLGVEIADDEVLNQDIVTKLIAKKTGIDLASFDVEEIKQKVAISLSKDLSGKIGFDVDLSGGLEAATEAAALLAIRSGRANKLVMPETAKAIRELAAATAAGLTVPEWVKLKNARKQKKWRVGKSFAWVEK